MNEPQEDLETDKLRKWQAELSGQADALRNEISARAARLNRIEEQLSLLSRLIELNNDANGAAEPERDVLSSYRHPSTNGSRNFEEQVEMVLRDHGKPMHISDIRSALIEAGCSIPGRGDDANIIVRMRNHPDRFTRTARGTYSLTEWGLPELKTSTRRPRAKGTR